MMNNKYHKDYYYKNKKYRKQNICKYCGKSLKKINKGKPPVQRRFTCNKCNSWMKGEYVFRTLVKRKDGKQPVYGVTIPKQIVEEYNLLGKKFSIKQKKNGGIIIYSQIKK